MNAISRDAVKAIVIEAHGGPEQLKLRDVHVPAPGPGQALVEVAAIGVNFMDVDTREGYRRGNTSLPLTLGVEGSGRVAALGAGVTGLNVGDRKGHQGAWIHRSSAASSGCGIPCARSVRWNRKPARGR
jgi:NADPH:quinone reductase